jgi:hypothetical protein
MQKCPYYPAPWHVWTQATAPLRTLVARPDSGRAEIQGA